MKYHKIRNVPMNVCTAEQKIAYNIAFAHYEIAGTYHSYAEAAQNFVSWCKDSIKNYDIDAVFCALNAGLENYCKAKYRILSSYEEIGRMFPANYLKNCA